MSCALRGGKGDGIAGKSGACLSTGANLSAHVPRHVDSPLSVAVFPIRPRQQELCLICFC